MLGRERSRKQQGPIRRLSNAFVSTHQPLPHHLFLSFTCMCIYVCWGISKVDVEAYLIALNLVFPVPKAGAPGTRAKGPRHTRTGPRHARKASRHARTCRRRHGHRHDSGTARRRRGAGDGRSPVTVRRWRQGVASTLARASVTRARGPPHARTGPRHARKGHPARAQRASPGLAQARSS